jgi:mTERF domain-containing protein
LVSSRKIAKYPLVWTTSFDERIIPRCSVFKVLLLKGLINENLSLGYVWNLSEEKFLESWRGL